MSSRSSRSRVSKRGWETRRKHEEQRRLAATLAAKKGWETRRANAREQIEAAARRSEAARKSWETRRANEVAARRSEATRKSWETRRANERAKKEVTARRSEAAKKSWETRKTIARLVSDAVSLPAGNAKTSACRTLRDRIFGPSHDMRSLRHDKAARRRWSDVIVEYSDLDWEEADDLFDYYH